MDIGISARVKFVFTIAFHYIYPSMRNGPGFKIVMMQTLFLNKGSIINQCCIQKYYHAIVLHLHNKP